MGPVCACVTVWMSKHVLNRHVFFTLVRSHGIGTFDHLHLTHSYISYTTWITNYLHVLPFMRKPPAGTEAAATAATAARRSAG